MGKNLITEGGGVMQLFNDTSKNPTSLLYLVKNERSLTVCNNLTSLFYASVVNFVITLSK